MSEASGTDWTEEDYRHERIAWFLQAAVAITALIVFGLVIRTLSINNTETERLRIEAEIGKKR